jgi:hypothetical protein
VVRTGLERTVGSCHTLELSGYPRDGDLVTEAQRAFATESQT